MTWAFVFASGIFMLVEAPLGRLEKLILRRESGSGSHREGTEQVKNERTFFYYSRDAPSKDSERKPVF